MITPSKLLTEQEASDYLTSLGFSYSLHYLRRLRFESTALRPNFLKVAGRIRYTERDLDEFAVAVLESVTGQPYEEDPREQALT